MNTISTICVVLCASTTLALAGGLHDADYILSVQNNQIIAGAVDPGTGDVVYPSPIKSALLGAEGFPNFTNDPGFNAELGQLIPGMTIGFSILRAPRVWDEIALDFDTIATEQITVRAAGQNFVAPSTDTDFEGIVFGQASTSASASFHHHMQYLLNGGLPPMVEGVWLLELELWTESAGIAPSDPLFLVFAQGDGVDQLDDAIAWIEDNLIGTPCLADLNDDGNLDFFDVSAFLTAYNAQDTMADFNNDGQFNFFDVSAFLTAYTGGCP
ncbi:MAG: hypothetical protein KDA29_06170 [Phycisphaerales bacterium]|nr:hypothetical protein [Phycisphaerales bacterium]